MTDISFSSISTGSPMDTYSARGGDSEHMPFFGASLFVVLRLYKTSGSVIGSIGCLSRSHCGEVSKRVGLLCARSHTRSRALDRTNSF